MKNFSLFLLSLSLSYIVFAQEAESQEAVGGPKITFMESVYDFGEIVQGDIVKHVFDFENTGTEPLILSNVRTTCGCTAPSWPREPIAPGEAATITISFNSRGKLGMQNKIITILSNASNAQESIRITTNVKPKTTEEG
ncbi:MAG: DUF1573 domain-containing protein [Cyclobacteriaceae bacterium]|nr:DUF1573 domain-containing protein [Cyclobacteriaceae bacterium HetDA_MAG_MS6]